jgi:hypothetical protein
VIRVVIPVNFARTTLRRSIGLRRGKIAPAASRRSRETHHHLVSPRLFMERAETTADAFRFQGSDGGHRPAQHRR